MKTSILLIGMVSLGFLNVNYAAEGNQASLNFQSENEQFLKADSIDSELKAIENEVEKKYYYDPSIVMPVTKKSIEQQIIEDNLIVESNLETDLLMELSNKSITQIIDEDIKITEAKNLNEYQPLDYQKIANKLNTDFVNKQSVLIEKLKL